MRRIATMVVLLAVVAVAGFGQQDISGTIKFQMSADDPNLTSAIDRLLGSNLRSPIVFVPTPAWDLDPQESSASCKRMRRCRQSAPIFRLTSPQKNAGTR